MSQSRDDIREKKKKEKKRDKIIKKGEDWVFYGWNEIVQIFVLREFSINLLTC